MRKLILLALFAPLSAIAEELTANDAANFATCSILESQYLDFVEEGDSEGLRAIENWWDKYAKENFKTPLSESMDGKLFAIKCLNTTDSYREKLSAGAEFVQPDSNQMSAYVNCQISKRQRRDALDSGSDYQISVFNKWWSKDAERRGADTVAMIKYCSQVIKEYQAKNKQSKHITSSGTAQALRASPAR